MIKGRHETLSAVTKILLSINRGEFNWCIHFFSKFTNLYFNIPYILINAKYLLIIKHIEWFKKTLGAQY